MNSGGVVDSALAVFEVIEGLEVACNAFAVACCTAAVAIALYQAIGDSAAPKTRSQDWP